MNNFTFYARNLNSYNPNTLESLEIWYNLSLETLDTDTSCMPINYSKQTIEKLAFVISTFIRNKSSLFLTSNPIRHDYLYKSSQRYKHVYNLYEV